MSKDIKRPSRYAGSWYNAAPNELKEEVASYTDMFMGKRQKAYGLISPHAGFMYSGDVAGMGYGSVIPPKNIILLGPAHRYAPSIICLWDGAEFETPLGELQINTELRQHLQANSELIAPDTEAHLLEHSLELQLPFIKHIAPEAQVLPVIIATHNFAELNTFSRELTAAITALNLEDVLVIASSDMSHYVPEQTAKYLDGKVIDAICKLDAKGTMDIVTKDNISMCGVAPAVVMMLSALQLGAKSGELIKYATSADKGSDPSEVVGYASLVVI